MSQINLLELAMAIVVAEEINCGFDKININNKVYKPYIDILRHIKLPSYIVNINGSGELEEINIISSTKNYELLIYNGRKLVTTIRWDEANSISQYINWISAFQDSDGNYVLALYKISFNNGIKIKACPTIEGDIYLDYVVVKSKVVY